MIFPSEVSKNPADNAVMHSEYLQHLKGRRVQEKSCVAAFLITNICSKTFIFWFSESKFCTLSMLWFYLRD